MTTTPTDGHPPAIVIQQGNGVARWFSWLGWMGLMFCIPVILGLLASYRDYFDTTGGIQEKFHSGSQTASKKIAVIRAVGVLADSNGFVKQQIDRIRKDEEVRAIVLRVDSPGGTVSASDYLYHHLCQLRDDRDLPIVVSMGGIAASGGYYIAMVSGDQENVIYAEPTSTTGSIGVIIPHYNISRLLEDWKVENDSIVSHPRKQLLSMTKPVSAEDRAILQRYVDQSFERFKEIVKSGRPMFREDKALLEKLATGEIFTAQQAVESRLVDRIGFLEDAIDRAAELAGLNVDNVRVVSYRRPPTVLGAVGFAESNETSLEQAIINLSVPRAYYLFTTLPGLASQ